MAGNCWVFRVKPPLLNFSSILKRKLLWKLQHVAAGFFFFTSLTKLFEAIEKEKLAGNNPTIFCLAPKLRWHFAANKRCFSELQRHVPSSYIIPVSPLHSNVIHKRPSKGFPLTTGKNALFYRTASPSDCILLCPLWIHGVNSSRSKLQSS